MVRRFLATLIALALVAGGLFAEDVKEIFKKFEDGKVTIEVDGKAKEYKVSPEAKYKTKKGDELLLIDAFKFLAKDSKGTFTIEDGVVTKAVREKKKDK